MRNKLVDWLCIKANEDKRITLITGDLGYSVLEKFADLYPERFVNAGVSEQNMLALAAGLASEGYLPFVYSIGVFPTFRCAEQIRNDVDYHHLPVTICAIGGGVAYGALGYSHHAFQDIALMRSLPNMIIATPSTPLEVVSILNWAVTSQKPIYLRLHKAGEREFHEFPPSVLPGIPLSISQSNNSKENAYTLICNSWLLDKASDIISKASCDVQLLSLPLWGQSCKEKFASSISNVHNLIVLEDHLLDGGLGSWILEVINEYGLCTRVKIFSIDRSIIGKVANEETLLAPTIVNLTQYIAAISN